MSRQFPEIFFWQSRDMSGSPFFNTFWLAKWPRSQRCGSLEAAAFQDLSLASAWCSSRLQCDTFIAQTTIRGFESAHRHPGTGRLEARKLNLGLAQEDKLAQIQWKDELMVYKSGWTSGLVRLGLSECQHWLVARLKRRVRFVRFAVRKAPPDLRAHNFKHKMSLKMCVE
jgi:hypothetical protein